MMNWIHKACRMPISVAACLACSLAVPAVAQAQILWANPWTYLDPVQARYGKISATATADGGAILVSGPSSSFNMQALRIDSAGAVVWNASLYGYWGSSGGLYEQEFGPTLVMEDGGAIVSLQSNTSYAYDGDITRLDSNGDIVWSRRTFTDWVARAGGDRIVYGDCDILSAAEIQTGDVIWHHSYRTGSDCGEVTGAVDGVGNVYATFEVRIGSVTTGYRLIKFLADGSIAWNVVRSATNGAAIIGTDGSALYVRSGSELMSVQTSDGTVAWTHPAVNSAVLTEDAPIEPLVISTSSVMRLDSVSGAVRWTANISVCGVGCAAPLVTSDSLVLNSIGTINRLDAQSGAVTWSVPLGDENEEGQSLRWHKFVRLAGGPLLGIAAVGSAGSPIHLQQFDFANGTMLDVIPTPMVALGAHEGVTAMDGTDVFDTAIGADALVQRIRLRRTDSVTGAVLWDNEETRLPANFNTLGYLTYAGPEGIGIGNDAVATASSWQRYGQQGPYGLALVSLHERATGAQRWSVLLWEPEQGLTYASEPKFDDAGNLYVATGTNLVCNFDSYCEHRRLYKFSGVTGQVLWMFDTGDLADEPARGGSYSQVMPPDFDVFGGDVVLSSRFPGTTHTLVRLSGSDGSPQWTSDLFWAEQFDLGFYRQDNDHIVVSSYPEFAKVDVTNAAVVWSAPFSFPPCGNTCNRYGGLVLSDGDLLTVGESDSRPRIQLSHNDGSGTSETWTLEPNDSGLRSIGQDVAQTPSGAVKIRLNRIQRYAPGRLSILAGLDTGSGTLTSQQVLSSGAIDATTDSVSKFLISMPAENRMLFRTYEVGETAPVSNGSGLLDTTITSNGDLTLVATTDNEVAAGEYLAFTLTVNYSGDQPIDGVSVNAGTYIWQGGLSDMICSTQNASNCTLDSRSGTIDATFDIQPGGTVEISGRVRIIQNFELNYFGGVVAGPIGLNESNTINNFWRTTLVPGIFANDFDSPAN